ncbi:Retrovirus-related Pol poly [Paramuricea clavata]|uniref:Retrovirus-related Pol poly n=1 Tax=Paramuricea clavata TaxID=317549 RepID=A0A7D9DGG2_PARCT|nr:Retrovirus-related Pol poly [Paramuricea clavata]
MELVDTGSAVSVLPLSKYNTTFKSSKLHPTTTVRKTYTGERIQAVGVLNVQVKYKEDMQKLNLYVVETNGHALFGRDWQEKITLDWKAINILATTPPGNPSTRLQEILDKYSDVFEEGIGLQKTTKAKLNLKENSQPKFCKARQLPYALRPKVEAELTKLQNNGILTKVGWSEWATPVVPVIKKNGNVRLCGDFKQTIKPVLHVQHVLHVVLGVASAPAIWQQAMDQILEGIPHVQCILDMMI